MRIFYAGCRYDHYDPRHGSSFEYENIYRALGAFEKITARQFAFERILEIGRRGFNAEILDAVKKERPDLFLIFMYSDELDPETLRALKKYTKTVAWFADDSWRFYNYSKYWAKYFSYAVTTYSDMPPRYRAAGQPNILVSQWAVNTSLYRPTARRGSGADVAFVGLRTAPRAEMVAGLERRGISFAVYGAGWPNGRVSQEDMIRIFSSSKINLALNPAPGFWNVNSLGRLVARPSINRIVPDFHLSANVESWLHRGIPQTKARHFEIPACGGFMMTASTASLPNHYIDGREMVVYKSLDDAAEKIRYYLDHDAEREAIARAGYERTVREHTYHARFQALFRAMGLRYDA